MTPVLVAYAAVAHTVVVIGAVVRRAGRCPVQVEERRRDQVRLGLAATERCSCGREHRNERKAR